MKTELMYNFWPDLFKIFENAFFCSKYSQCLSFEPWEIVDHGLQSYKTFHWNQSEKYDFSKPCWKRTNSGTTNRLA